MFAAVLVLVSRNIMTSHVEYDDPRPALAELSVSKYRPMFRLLEEDDILFLKNQPGYRPGMERRLMAERRRVMRQYLSAMCGDFSRLHSLATDMLLAAPEDQPELARVLFDSKFRFMKCMALAHAGLAMHALGVPPVSIQGLTSAFESLEVETLNVTRTFALNASV
jgi:hypothetical protein